MKEYKMNIELQQSELPLTEHMKYLLGSTVVLYWKIHSFHFNIEGPHFYDYHKLLNEFYEDVYETVDKIGEYIRTLDCYAPVSLSRICELSVIHEQQKVPRAELMLAELCEDSDTMINLINQVFECATNEKEENIANFMAELLDIYKKYCWFMKSILKKSRG